MDPITGYNQTKSDDISNDKNQNTKSIEQKHQNTYNHVIINGKYGKIIKKDLRSRQAHTQATKDNPKLNDKWQDDTHINEKTKNFEKTIYNIDQESKERLSELDDEIKKLKYEVEEKTKNLGKNTKAAGKDFENKIQKIIDNNEESNSTFNEKNQELKKQIEDLQKMSFFSKVKNLFSSSGAETNKFSSLLQFLKKPMKILGKIIDVAITVLAVVGAAYLLGTIGGVIAAGIGIFYIIYKTADEATEVQINNLKDRLDELTMKHSENLLESHKELTSVAKNALGCIHENSELIDLRVRLDQKRVEYCTLKTKALQRVVDIQEEDIGKLNKEIENANNERLKIQKSLQDRTNDLVENIENQQNILKSYEKNIDSILSANKNITNAHSGIAKEIGDIQNEIALTNLNLSELIKKLFDSSKKIEDNNLDNITKDIESILETSNNIVKTATNAMDNIFKKTENINIALNSIAKANESLSEISKKKKELQEAKLKNNKKLADVLVAMLGKKHTIETTLESLKSKINQNMQLDDLVKKLYEIHNGKVVDSVLSEKEFNETISIIKLIAVHAKEDQKSKIFEIISNIESNNELLGKYITDLGEKINDIHNGLKNIKNSNDAIKKLSNKDGEINKALEESSKIAEKMKDIKIVYDDNSWFSWLGESLANFFSRISQNMAKAKEETQSRNPENQEFFSWDLI